MRLCKCRVITRCSVTSFQSMIIPGNSVSPENMSVLSSVSRLQRLTSIGILFDSNRNLALVLDLRRLGCEQRAVTKITAPIHGPLQCVVLPTKDIVAVLAVAGPCNLSDMIYHSRVVYLTCLQWRASTAGYRLRASPPCY